MQGIKHLLLLAAFVLLARCQQKPEVSMLPKLKQIYSGDLFFLKCDKTASGSTVKWYFNDSEQTSLNETWKIGLASPKHSGFYQCERNGKKSDPFTINVLDYYPSASLTMQAGQPVVRMGGSVVLQLDNEDGLQGWRCQVNRGEVTRTIVLRLTNGSVSVVFQPNRLNIPETIFWCTDREKVRRSNQITIRTSAKDVSLEMSPLIAVAGERLTLKCLAWGAALITNNIFYKDDKILVTSPMSTHTISNVTQSSMGRYKCQSTFTYMKDPAGPPYEEVSDNQDVLVQEPPVKAVLSENSDLSCSCPHHPSDNYQWYYKDNGQKWKLTASDVRIITPKMSGTYACRAVWNNGRSSLSNSYVYRPPITILYIIYIIGGIIIGLVILCVPFVVIYIYYRKRNTTGPLYEDLPLKSRDEGDDKYEKLQKGARKEGEYDTLRPEEPDRLRKEGEYEALKKDEMTGGEYHTVRMEGAVGGEGGYEALKKEGMTGGEYHTVRMEGAVGGEGGYEALKKEGISEGEYKTLGDEGAGGGE